MPDPGRYYKVEGPLCCPGRHPVHGCVLGTGKVCESLLIPLDFPENCPLMEVQMDD